MDYRDGMVAILDYDLRTSADPCQEPGKIAGSFGFRDVDHMVRHEAIIALSTCRGDGSPLGQEFADFFRRHNSASFGVPDASSMAARVSSSSSSKMVAGFSKSNLCAFAIELS